VEEILRAEDGKAYGLQAWVIMPNHVHLVVNVWQTPLSGLLNQWKGSSAYDVNRLLGRRGVFWQRENFDTVIRDSDHLARAIRYTESNPTKAALVREAKQWQRSSARWRDAYNRLPWQKSTA
jgi:putative transposase